MTAACAKNQSGKRKVVVVIRERGGETLPGVFKTEGQALSWVKRRVVKGTVLHADEASVWNDLHARFEMKRIDHQQAYSARRRLHELGGELLQPPASRRGWPPPPHLRPVPAPLRAGSGWREDNRRVPNGEQVQRVAKLALGRKKSVDFTGYWQRHVKGLSDQ